MNILKKGWQAFTRLEHFIDQKSKESESQIIPFASLGLLLYFFYNFCLNYQNGFQFFVFVHPEVAVLSILLLLKNFWPACLKPFFSWYWLLCLFYLMPVLMTELFLQNPDSLVWMLVELSMALLLALLLDWITYIDLLCLGLFTSFVIYELSSAGNFPNELIHKQFLFVFFVCILVAVFLLRSRNIAQREQIKTLNLLSAVMAHELRTPMLSMRASVLALRKHLPLLIKGYQQALRQGDSLEPIREDRLEALEKSGDEMILSLNYSAMVIDALVAGFNNTSLVIEFSSLDVSQAIMSAIEQYPFRPEEINLVELLQFPNLKVVGNEAIFVHIFHNLFKFVLFRIKETDVGEIRIWVEKKSNKACIFLECDSGPLPEHLIKHIFDINYSDDNKPARMGTCLYLSKAAVDRMDGTIECESREKSFVFILTFRLADNV